MDISRILGKVTTGTLITAGLVAVVFSIGEIFIDYSSISYLKEAPSVTVPLVVGLLCFAIGLERLDDLKSIKQILNSIKTGVENFGSVQFLTNYKRQFDIIGRIVDDTHRRLYILSFDLNRASLNTDTEPYKLYIKRVINSIEKHPSLEYKVVLGIDSPNLSPHQTNVLRSRKDTFVRAGVWNRAAFAYRQLPVGLTILISDETVVIGFPSLSRDPSPRNMIVLSKAELAEYISDWYEKHIWNGAIIPSF